MTSRILLNEHQASKIIGFKASTLRIRRFKGLEPHYLKVGGKVFYEANVIEDYLKSCVTHKTPHKKQVKEVDI